MSSLLNAAAHRFDLAGLSINSFAYPYAGSGQLITRSRRQRFTIVHVNRASGTKSEPLCREMDERLKQKKSYRLDDLSQKERFSMNCMPIPINETTHQCDFCGVRFKEKKA